jgi:acyl-CoA reductase-like NAD-dependent aldehyde dehydrogenase
MFEAKLLINDVDADASGNAAFERRSPISDDVVTIASAASVSDATHAANAAAAAFPEWAAVGPSIRRKILNEASRCLDLRRAEIKAAMADEIGASGQWADFNVDLAQQILEEAAALTSQITGQVIPSNQSGTLSMGYRQAAGVCLGIAPWNAPVVLGFRAIAMALACGNTVVLKASELCPKTHRLIGDVMHDAGLPAGVLNIVSNAPADAEKVVNALIAHPAIRRINFTGSTRVGRTIAEKAAHHLKRCLLELGGKAPFIVLEDADLDEAAKAAAFGAFMNQGQICMSTERIIVFDSVADAFIDKLVERARKLIAGDTRSGDFPLGPVITSQAIGRISALISDAIAKGAELKSGGKVRGNILDATVVDHVTPSMRLYHEESFGPVVAVIRVEDADEAITVANNSEYGLSAAIFSRDTGRALDLAKRLETGICHINAATVADEPQMPFGGVKASGYGRFGGLAAIDEFTELRWITISSSAGEYPI